MRVGFAVFPGFQMMSLAAGSVFEFANICSGEAIYELATVSEQGGLVRSSTGLAVATGPLAGLAFDTLLVGGGVGIAPLVDTAERAVRQDHQVVAMMGARTDRHLLAASEWPKEVEYVVVTEDGSAGPKGFVTEHLGQYQEWASKIYACGPNPMFASLADALRRNGRRQQPEILMEENMPCGWGMCYGCAIFTKHGVRLCCTDGPRFNLFDVY